AARQLLDRTDEVEVLDLAHEGDGVALGVAPEAVVEAELGVHRERGRLLAVERAQPLVPPADPPQLEVLADEGDDVGGLPDPHHVLVDDPHGCRTVPADGRGPPGVRPVATGATSAAAGGGGAP